MTDNPLNPEVLTSNVELFKVASTHHFHGIECLCGFKNARSRDRTEHIMLHTLVASQPVVNSVEELDALPQETVIRSVLFGIVRERLDSGWLATGGEEIDDSGSIAGRDHVVLYRPEVPGA